MVGFQLPVIDKSQNVRLHLPASEFCAIKRGYLVFHEFTSNQGITHLPFGLI